jgi:hypothetical protein
LPTAVRKAPSAPRAWQGALALLEDRVLELDRDVLASEYEPPFPIV